ncbi:DUF2812 domain-containing protein [Streptococcus ictaluri]|uniref:DUF2812 domain-containing protein n=1 Tax=Streptococcus ictaluri 707-05 TaxID=764299 RepID=G5K6A5_9STRE|nr:DUF2812 domain-containing protein [Streptococcus ictaluri]EHI68703.1 hypothetical protein STRIC_0592 [Streptococcus ictaluri 707-05]
MKKIHFFAYDLEKEEAWINRIQSKGYVLEKVGIFLPLYTFKRSKESEERLVRLDYRKFKDYETYEDYQSLFEDCGWKHLSGSLTSGVHYFQRVDPQATSDIFSDLSSTLETKERV